MAPHVKDPKSAASLSERYKVLLVPEVTRDEEDERTYSDFLLEQERTVGPDGFLDSKKYRNSYVVQKGLIHPAFPACRERNNNNVKSAEHHLEETLWQKRQEARALRRAQGDVTKRCRALQDQAQTNQNDIQIKILDVERQEKDLQKKSEERTQRETVRRQQVTKDSASRRRLDIQSLKTEQRERAAVVSPLQAQYSRVSSELRRRRSGIQRLRSEYEEQRKKEEDEERRLRKELSELAAILSVETKREEEIRRQWQRAVGVKRAEKLKGEELRVQDLEIEQRHVENQLRSLQQQRWRQEANLSTVQNHWSRRNAEESRKSLEITNQMKMNVINQQRLQQEMCELRRMTRETGNLQRIHISEPKPANIHLSEPAASGEDQRLELEHGAAHIQRSVSLRKQFEKRLFAGFRSVEHSYKKTSASVQSLQQELVKRRRQNCVQLHKVAAETAKEEQDLLLRLKKEEGELRKLQDQRQSIRWKLLEHRSGLQEDLRGLQLLEKERQRLSRLDVVTSPKENAEDQDRNC